MTLLPGSPVAPAARPLPELTDVNRAFWTGGHTGHLQLLHCEPCRRFVHPPQPICPECREGALSCRPVCGRGVVVAKTVNHYPWLPRWTVPYVIASIELVEQPGLRVTSNVVGIPPEDVQIGLEVRVDFEPDREFAVPLFVPDATNEVGQ
jgi:uncharacterized OB-fold protein